MKADAAAREWLKAERLVRRHGLPLPARRRAEIAKALAEETARTEREGHALLRALAVLLWSARHPADAPAIAGARFQSRDTAAMIGPEFLLCGPVEDVRAALAASGSPVAGAALADIAALAETAAPAGGFDDALAAEQAFYGIEAAPFEG